MNKMVVYMSVLLIVLVGVALGAKNEIQNVNTNGKGTDINVLTNSITVQVSNILELAYQLFMRISIPKSLDEQYNGSVPETMSSPYLFKMLKMTEFFEGVIVNVQENDIVNARNSFNQFSEEYNNISTLVPEWGEYFNNVAVDQLGKDLNTGNVAVDTIMQDIGNVAVSCDRCHGNELPQVWAKYYWRDFDTVNVNTPIGNMAWPDAMPIMATGFDGISVDLKEGQRQEAYNSWQLFKTMLLNFKDKCDTCHDSPRYYFVSNDAIDAVDKIGADILGNVAVDEIILEQQQFGNNCHRCHVIHQPAQRMKDKMER